MDFDDIFFDVAAYIMHRCGEKSKDGIDIAKEAWKKGKEEYGETLTRANLSEEEVIRHTAEELIDVIYYLIKLERIQGVEAHELIDKVAITLSQVFHLED